MSQGSTSFALGQDYFMGNYSVVKLSARQWVSINCEGIMKELWRNCEGIVNVEDLLEFKDDDIDNVFLNLRQPQDV